MRQSSRKSANKTACYNLYDIVYSRANSRYAGNLCLITKTKLTLNGLGTAVDSFPQYTVFKILGKPDYKNCKYMIKEEYKEFVALRELNSMYFIPYIKEIIDLMNSDICLR